MFAEIKSIKGFSLYGTDGRGVYLRGRLIRPEGEVYRLIPDNGDGVNVVDISTKDALNAGNKVERKASKKTARKRS